MLFKQPLVLLVANYLDVFAQNDSDVGSTNLAFHEIDTFKVRPLRQTVCRLIYCEMRTELESKIDKLVNAKIARFSTSPWASPVFMVKKDGWLMCVDYCRLNSVKKI